LNSALKLGLQINGVEDLERIYIQFDPARLSVFAGSKEELDALIRFANRYASEVKEPVSRPIFLSSEYALNSRVVTEILQARTEELRIRDFFKDNG